MLPFISFITDRPNEGCIRCSRTAQTDCTELAATRFVRKMCIRSHLKGYSYLITAIVFGKSNPHLLSSLTNLLYPAVAAVYNTTPNAVERNIRSAIESAAKNDPDKLQSVFYYHTRKPYISEVLAIAMETIRLETEIGNDSFREPTVATGFSAANSTIEMIEQPCRECDPSVRGRA
jgi:hypothetical protein